MVSREVLSSVFCSGTLSSHVQAFSFFFFLFLMQDFVTDLVWPEESKIYFSKAVVVNASTYLISLSITYQHSDPYRKTDLTLLL